ITISVPRPEMKNAKAMKFQVTGQLGDLLRQYLKRIRPLLLERPSSALFPGPAGNARDRKVFGRQISGLLRREIGLAWNPHLFRHLAAYLLRKDGANNYVEAQLVLGHRSADTTRRSYEGFDAAPAFAKLDRLIDDQSGAPSRERKGDFSTRT